MYRLVFTLLILSNNCESRFQDAYSKWSIDKDCQEDYCTIGDDCKYKIEPIRPQKNFGAEITGLDLG